MSGYSETLGGHAWNVVKIAGKWFYVDVTNNDYGDNVTAKNVYLLRARKELDVHHVFKINRSGDVGLKVNTKHAKVNITKKTKSKIHKIKVKTQKPKVRRVA